MPWLAGAAEARLADSVQHLVWEPPRGSAWKEHALFGGVLVLKRSVLGEGGLDQITFR